MAKAGDKGITLELPVDHVVAPKLEAGAATETLTSAMPPFGDRMGLDIGPEDRSRRYAERSRRREDGRLERPDGRVRDRRRSRSGTIAVARAVADVKGTTVIGGGDSIAAVAKAGRHRPDHPHLHRRRRVARVPRRAELPGAVAGRGDGAARIDRR